MPDTFHSNSGHRGRPMIVDAMPRYTQHFRLFVSVVGIVLSLIYHILVKTSDYTTALIQCSVSIGYFSITYCLLLSRYKRAIYFIRPYVSLFDPLAIFLIIASIHYNPVPSAFILALSLFNLLIQDIHKQTLKIIIGLLAGIMLYYVLPDPTSNLHEIILLNAITLLMSIFYLCAYATLVKRQQRELVLLNAHLQRDRDNFRSQAYRLSRYLPSSICSRIKGQNAHLKTERRRITVFFSDIVGFTELSEELEAETLTELLNSYLSEMSNIATEFKGTVDKFMGDSIMVLFGDDESHSQGAKKDAIQCVSMALAMEKRMHELQPQWLEMGIRRPLQIRIGINSGYCTVGTFGTHDNLDYTALGAHVNLASRLESSSKPGEILVSYETWSLIKEVILCRDKGEMKAKGFSHPIQVYQVINHRKELGANQSYLSTTVDGFSLHLDLEKIKNYDKEKVMTVLNKATQQLKDKHIS